MLCPWSSSWGAECLLNSLLKMTEKNVVGSCRDVVIGRYDKFNLNHEATSQSQRAGGGPQVTVDADDRR